MIELANVTKMYGDFTAVRDLSLTVKEGEIFGFLGVNGAGKTTTIRMLTGILLPSSGSITIGGFNMNEEPVQAKAITGYVPDRPYLYGKLTGREFLYFCADLYSVPKQIAEERIDALLEEYNLLDWQNGLIESYSHGMKQRIAMCAALVHDPKVLIIDEPMVGLDPHGARMLKNSIRKYAEAGKCIFLSTHSLNVAQEVSHRVAILHQGEILTTGTVDEIQHLAGTNDAQLETAFIELTSAAQTH
jgi:ABC-2 type transport system ATP-binding protein